MTFLQLFGLCLVVAVLANLTLLATVVADYRARRRK